MKEITAFRPWRSKTLLLSFGNFAAALMLLVRNIIIARLISVEDFGIASSLAIAVTLIETMTNLGMDRLIVQDRRGGTKRFLASIHSVQVLRGFLGTALTLMFAHLYASLMGLSEHVWAYQWLAVIPLLRGFYHFGIHRAQRLMRFRPVVSVTIVSNALALVSALPLGLWLGDFRAMLGAILIQHLLFVVGSHVLSGSRYTLSWSPAVVRDCVRFGAPLLVNGIIIFATLNGDQVLIGSYLGMEALGQFAVAFSLTLVPATVLANTLQSLMLPGLARNQSDPHAFVAAAGVVLRIAFMMAIGQTVLLALVGPVAIGLLFGARYDIAMSVLPWLAVLQGIRIAKAGPAILAIASADTRDPLFANLARLACVPLAVIWLGNGGDILSVVAVAIFGELAALALSIVLLIRRGRMPVMPEFWMPRHG